MNVMSKPKPQRHMEAQQLQAIGWAVTHAPTVAAYERHSGESIAPAVARFIRWAEDNLIGGDR